MRWSPLLLAGLWLGAPSLAVAAPDAFSTCLATLKAQAGKQGIVAERFDVLTAGLTPDRSCRYGWTAARCAHPARRRRS